MPDLQFDFTLNNSMASGLKSISTALSGMLDYLEEIDKSIEGIGGSDFSALKKSVSSACSEVDALTQGFGSATQSVTSLNKSNLSSLNKETSGAAKGISGVSSAATTAASSLKGIDGLSLSGVVAQAGSASKGIESIGTASDQVRQELNSLNGINVSPQGLSEIPQSAARATESIQGIESAAKTSSSQIDRLGSADIKSIGSDASQVSSKIDQIGTEANSVKSDLKEISEINLDNGSAQSLADTLSGLSSAVDLSNFMNITEIASGLTDKIAEIGESALDSSEVMTNSINTFKVGLGATAEEAEHLQDIASNVFSSGFGDSIQGVSEQLTYMKQVLGDAVDDSRLEPLLSQFITLEGAGMDYNETLRSVRNLMVGFGVDAQTVTNYLAEGMNRGLNYTDELGDNLAEYSARWGEAGVSLGSYLSLLEAGTQNGAYNLDKVGDFLNEFLTSLSDGRMEGSLSTLSGGTQELFSLYQQNKASAQDVLNSVLTDMQNITSETDRAALASTLWGSLGEDNAMGMIMSLNGVHDGFTDVAGAGQALADANSNAVTELRNKWDMFKNEALAPIGDAFAQVGVGALNAIQPVIDFFKNNGTAADALKAGVIGLTAAITTFAFGSAIASLPSILSSIAGAFGTLNAVMLANPFVLIAAAIVGIGAALIYAWNNSETFRNVVIGVWDSVKGAFEQAWTNISGVFSSLAQGWDQAVASAQNFWNNLTTTVSTWWTETVNWGTTLISNFLTGISSKWTDITTSFQTFFTDLSTTVSSWWTSSVEWGSNVIQGFKDGLIQKWEEVTSWFTDSWNWVVNKVTEVFQIGSPSKVFNGIGTDLISGFLGGLKGSWESVTSWFSDAWQGLKDTVSGWWNNIWGGDDESSESAPGVDYTETINNVKAQMEQLTAEVEAGFTAITQEAVTATATMSTQTLSAYSAMATQIVAIAGQLAQQVSTQFLTIDVSPLGAKLTAELTAVLNTLQANAVKAVTGLIAQMTSALAPLSAAFSTAFNAITQNSIRALQTLYTSAMTQLTAISKGAQTQTALMAQAVVNAYSTMAKTVTLNLTGFATTAVNAVKTMGANITGLTFNLQITFISIWNTLKNETLKVISKLSSDVFNAIKQMNKRIQDKVSELPPYFSAIATLMMGNLRSGIYSRIGDVTSVAGSLVQQLKNTFESGLAIHSPSDYMFWIGQMMLAGLIQGMSGSQVQKFIENMIAGMQSSFENGSFDANKVVNFLSDNAVLDLIGRVSGVDTNNLNPQQIAYPLIGTLGTQTSWFGPRPYPGAGGSTNHGGVDLASPTGTPIAAALAGTVTTAGSSDGYGNLVVVNHGNGIETYYGHMSQIGTKVGATVAKGQQIGLVGSTGNSTGPHLHFEVRQNGQKLDPQPYLEGAGLAGVNSLSSALQNAYNLKHGLPGLVMMSAGAATYNPSSGAQQWAGVAAQALAMLGQPASLLSAVLYAIDSESGGNPYNVNTWDSNAAAGHPSQGLMQTIPETFEAYRHPGLSADIFDPLSNIYAGLNYMIHTYGSIENVVGSRLGGWYGYEVGTRYVPSDMFAMLHKGEAVIPAGQNPYADSGGDYLADLFDYEPYLRAEGTATPTYAGGNNTTIELYITQNIDDSSNPRGLADEILSELYNQLEQEYKSQGGGVSAIY